MSNKTECSPTVIFNHSQLMLFSHMSNVFYCYIQPLTVEDCLLRNNSHGCEDNKDGLPDPADRCTTNLFGCSVYIYISIYREQVGGGSWWTVLLPLPVFSVHIG